MKRNRCKMSKRHQGSSLSNSRSHNTTSAIAVTKKRHKISGNHLVKVATASAAFALHHVTTDTAALLVPSATTNQRHDMDKKRATTSRYFQKQSLILPEQEPPNSNSKIHGTQQERSRTKSLQSHPEASPASRTHSFPPLISSDKSIQVHTLILGTHPSITSLAKVQYFAHPQNAFWWIAGDCLGFRRSTGISPSSGKPYKLTDYILHGEDKIIPYEEQIQTLTSKGFALWDLFQSCERKGSLDNDIRDGQPNHIREFCEEIGTIRRIIMANGSKQCEFFNQHFGQWWLDGGLRPGQNDLSQKAFGKWSKKTNGFQTLQEDGMRQIEVYCMPGVSPAAASISYMKKREEFKTFCYDPGLMDYEQWSDGTEFHSS